MIIKGRDGIYRIERSEWNSSEKDIEKYNKKYGEGNWRFIEPTCSCLSEECGYGKPLDRNTCKYCDGRCVRPTMVIIPL